MAELAREIRALMIPAGGVRLLLPNATVAEVIAYTGPEVIAGAPQWLLGRIAWRGWNVPLISFVRLSGLGGDDGETRSAKIAVLKALNGDPKLPFMATLASGFPRLMTITQDMLVPSGDERQRMAGVLTEALVRDAAAIIPDLSAIEDLLTEAIAT